MTQGAAIKTTIWQTIILQGLPKTAFSKASPDTTREEGCANPPLHKYVQQMGGTKILSQDPI